MRTSRIVLLVAGGSLLAAVGAIGYFLLRGPDLSAYERFREPQLVSMLDQPVLLVEARGDPATTGDDAIGLLFRTYYRLDGVSKKGPPPAPRARWPSPADTPRDQWIGHFAMPIPGEVKKLPADAQAKGLVAKLAVWEYGEVAQILHVGGYDKEGPAIERLKAFIDRSGYRIIGPHEEEYLRGPGMLLRSNPDDHYTLIRYRVARRGN